MQKLQPVILSILVAANSVNFQIQASPCDGILRRIIPLRAKMPHGEPSKQDPNCDEQTADELAFKKAAIDGDESYRQSLVIDLARWIADETKLVAAEATSVKKTRRLTDDILKLEGFKPMIMAIAWLSVANTYMINKAGLTTDGSFCLFGPGFGAENPMIVFTPQGKIFKGFMFKREIAGRLQIDYSQLQEQYPGWTPAP